MSILRAMHAVISDTRQAKGRTNTATVMLISLLPWTSKSTIPRIIIILTGQQVGDIHYRLSVTDKVRTLCLYADE